MRVPLTLAALVLTAGAAGAQSYQSSLPVSPAERRAIEARISTILDYAPTNQTASFDLPSGRIVSVRPYEIVRQQGGAPCRGYRIDLAGSNGTSAVDGFRCKRGGSQVWEIVEPELVLESTGARSGQVVVESRQPDEPIYPSDNPAFPEEAFAPDAQPDDGGPIVADGPAPVPRPAPRAEAPSGNQGDTLIAGLPQTSTPVDLDPLPADEPEPLPAEEPEIAAEPEPAPEPEPVPEPAANAEAPREVTPAAPREVASVGGPARVVGEESAPTGPLWSENADVVGALRDLDYITAETDVDEETVSAAIDEFATDERFALPISPDALQERLDAAIDRSEMLPVCEPGETSAFCLDNQ